VAGQHGVAQSLHKSPQSLEVHRNCQLRCIIDQQLTASPLNGKPFDGHEEN
jgi:hypothetical protein